MTEAKQNVTESAEPKPQAGEEQNEAKTFDAEYVDKLRKEAAKYRTEAKANSEAANRLAEIEEANKTEAQKTADRLAEAQREAEEARREASLYKIATESKLSDEDAELLRHISTEEGMRLVAQRLSADIGERKADEEPQRTNALGPYVPPEGNPAPSTALNADPLLDDLKNKLGIS